MSKRIIGLSAITILLALSFLYIVNMPTWIYDSSYEILIYTIWFFSFAMMYAVVGFGGR